MLETDSGALICDLAEVYHIFDYKQFPPSKVAVLAIGLRDDSRIKMKMNNMRHSIDTMLLAALVDRMSLLLWAKTEDGMKGYNRPKSVFDQLMGEEKRNDIVAFDTPEDFEKEWNKIAKRGEA